MYQYKYIPVDTRWRISVWLPGAPGAHRQYAAEEWRYIGFFPVSFTGHGGISQVDLIFERES